MMTGNSIAYILEYLQSIATYIICVSKYNIINHKENLSHFYVSLKQIPNCVADIDDALCSSTYFFHHTSHTLCNPKEYSLA